MKDEKLHTLLKDYFNSKIDLPKENADCPSIEMLAQYASGGLSGHESYKVGSHVKTCRFCNELVEGALLYSAYAKEIKLKDVSAKMRERAKSLNPAYAGKKHKLMS